MNIKYAFIERFSSLNEKQVTEIAALVKQLSPQRNFEEKLLHRAMMFGSLCVAFDAEAESKIVGIGLLLYRNTIHSTSASIEDVIVDADYRKHGIGRAIMTTLIHHARTFLLPIEHVDLTSRPGRVEANHLYQSLGFTIRETNCYRLRFTP